MTVRTAGKWVGIWLVCNLVTLCLFFGLLIVGRLFSPDREELSIVATAERETYKWYFHDLEQAWRKEPDNSVSCEIETPGADTLVVICSVIEDEKLVWKRSWIIGRKGEVAGHVDWDLNEETGEWEQSW